MKIPTYNVEGKNVGTMELPDRIFAAKWNSALVKQVYDGEQANRRKPWAHTKDRSEVRGGGRKPWRQKGTGRARHGSIRSPLWVGGGISHGPRKDRDYSVKINKKMKNTAVRSLLTQKLKDGLVVMLDQFLLKNPKTKEAATVLKNLQTNASLTGISSRKTLIAVPHNESTIRAVRNLPKVSYIEPRNVNTTALLHSAYVVLDASSLEELQTILK